MSLDKYVVITQKTAPHFLADGGEIVYELAYDDKGDETFLIFGVKPDGERIKCVITNTGTHKSLKHMPSILAFHRSCYPDGKPITVPTVMNKQNSENLVA